MATNTAFVAGAFLWRESEFVSGLTGACGPNALAMAASWARQSRVSTLSVYQTMHAHNLCDSNGVSTIGSLHAAAPLLGLTVASYRAYAEPWPQWQTWMLAQLSAGNAVVVEVANGQALQDALTGQGENATNLRYHFFTVVGHINGSFVCLDGDNLSGGNYRSNGFQAANVAQHYTDAVMSAARPCAAIAIAGEKAKPMPTTTGAGAGFDAYAAANNITARLDAYIPLDIDHAAAVYDDGTVLYWQSGQDISANHAGTALLAVNAKRIADEAELAALHAELAALRQQLATAQAALAKAEADLAAAKSAQPPAPVPPTPATDPETQKAVALVAAIRAALAA